MKNLRLSYQRHRRRSTPVKPLPVLLGIITIVVLYLSISILIIPLFADKHPEITLIISDFIVLFSSIVGGAMAGSMIESKGALHGMLVGFGAVIVYTTILIIPIATELLSASLWYIIEVFVFTNIAAIIGGSLGGFLGNRLQNHSSRSTT